MPEHHTAISVELMFQLLPIPVARVVVLAHVRHDTITATAFCHFLRAGCHAVEAMAKALRDKNKEGGSCEAFKTPSSGSAQSRYFYSI